MKIINLTPHEISFFDDETIVAVIPQSGKTARLIEFREPLAPLTAPNGAEVRVDRVRLGGLVDTLPEWQSDVYYIVSKVTAMAFPHRKDLLFPTEEVRNAEGAIIGCRGLGRYEGE